MPRRLVLAAEIVMDVAESLPEPDRSRLVAAASDLQSWAGELARRQGLALDFCPQMDRLRPSIRRLAAALDPECRFPSGAPRLSI